MKKLTIFIGALCALLIFSSLTLTFLKESGAGLIVTPHEQQRFFRVSPADTLVVIEDQCIAVLSYKVTINDIKPHALRLVDKTSAGKTPVFTNLCNSECTVQTGWTEDDDFYQQILLAQGFDGIDNRGYLQRTVRKGHGYECIIHVIDRLAENDHYLLQMIPERGKKNARFTVSLSDETLQTSGK